MYMLYHIRFRWHCDWSAPHRSAESLNHFQWRYLSSSYCIRNRLDSKNKITLKVFRTPCRTANCPMGGEAMLHEERKSWWSSFFATYVVWRATWRKRKQPKSVTRNQISYWASESTGNCGLKNAWCLGTRSVATATPTTFLFESLSSTRSDDKWIVLPKGSIVGMASYIFNIDLQLLRAKLCYEYW
jgi:hypothetical protein